MIQLIFSAEAKNQLAHEREHHPDRMVRRKMNVLCLKSCDMGHHAISLLANVSDSTVTRYLKEYKDGGIEGLKRKHYRPPVSELNKHKEKIEADFTTCPPHTVSEAQARIEQLTGIKRSQTQVRNFFRRIGLKFRTLILPACLPIQPGFYFDTMITKMFMVYAQSSIWMVSGKKFGSKSISHRFKVLKSMASKFYWIA